MCRAGRIRAAVGVQDEVADRPFAPDAEFPGDVRPVVAVVRPGRSPVPPPCPWRAESGAQRPDLMVALGDRCADTAPYVDCGNHPPILFHWDRRWMYNSIQGMSVTYRFAGAGRCPWSAGGLPTRDRLPVGKGGAGHMRKSRFPLRIVARTGWPGSEAATEDHQMVGSTLTGRSQETWLYSGEPVVQ